MTDTLQRGRTFIQVLINTAVANVTTSFLWFALTFWVYLETRSVLATGVIGGAYMLLVALFGMVFGTIVDRHRKHQAMIFASFISLVGDIRKVKASKGSTFVTPTRAPSTAFFRTSDKFASASLGNVAVTR